MAAVTETRLSVVLAVGLARLASGFAGASGGIREWVRAGESFSIDVIALCVAGDIDRN